MRFSEKLERLGFDSYEAYLQSDHWRNFKRSYKKSGRPCRCAVCNAHPIEIHHHTYDRLGTERLTDVTPLCREHHLAVHIWLKDNKLPVERTPTAVSVLRKQSQPRKKKKNKKLVAIIARRKERQQAKIAVAKPPAVVIIQTPTPRKRKLHHGRREATKTTRFYGDGAWNDPEWAMQAIARGLKRPPPQPK